MRLASRHVENRAVDGDFTQSAIERTGRFWRGERPNDQLMQGH
jgi:hypothetical protein